jgi:hypothetical protein
MVVPHLVDGALAASIWGQQENIIAHIPHLSAAKPN